MTEAPLTAIRGIVISLPYEKRISRKITAWYATIRHPIDEDDNLHNTTLVEIVGKSKPLMAALIRNQEVSVVGTRHDEIRQSGKRHPIRICGLLIKRLEVLS